MAAKTLQDFTLSAVVAPDDFVVGYDTATSGGERRWSVSTLSNAVSGIIAQSIQEYTSPTGLVAYFAATSAPKNWIECNGAALSATPTTSSLRNFLISNGNPFGVSGSDPLLPDLRGKFIRSSGTDGTYAAGTFGQLQTDLIKNHTHSGTTGGQSQTHTHSVFAVSEPQGAGGIASGNQRVNEARTSGNASVDHSHSFTTGNPDSGQGGTETRPANVALLACIKL